jgi:hypothetical protein
VAITADRFNSDEYKYGEMHDKQMVHIFKPEEGNSGNCRRLAAIVKYNCHQASILGQKGTASPGFLPATRCE